MDSSKKMAWSIPEFAAASGLGDRTVRRLIAERKIRFVRVGRRILIPTDAVADFFAANVVIPIDASKEADRLLGRS